MPPHLAGFFASIDPSQKIKFWFRYSSSKPACIDVSGDDDVWVFVNGVRAIDLGGYHTPLDGSLVFEGNAVTATAQLAVDLQGNTLDTATVHYTPANFGLSEDGLYEVEIFHAERQAPGSAFKLHVAGLIPQHSLCTRL